MPSSAIAITTCANSIQERRRPSQRLSSGIGARSIKGAQSTLIEWAIPTQLKKPMAVSSTPRSRSQALKVPPTNSNGKPAENPRNSMPITRGLR